MNLASLKKVELGGDCPICLENMNEPTRIVITKCSHAFHEKCVTSHLDISERARASCPYCRQMPVPMVRVEESPDGVEKNPHIEPQMHRALREDDLNYVKAALLAEPHLIDPVFDPKTNNYPLLMLAAKFGHQDIVTFLLNKVKKEAIDKLSPDGLLSALSIACFWGHEKIAELLITAGAKVNHVNCNGKSALWFAASAGRKEVMELLVKLGASVTNKSKDNVSALFIAAQNGHLETVNYLISVIPVEELKEHINICSSIEPATALYMATQAGHTDVVSALIAAGADPNLAMSDGSSPLHIAALNGHLEIVKLLIASGASVNYQSQDGVTALTCAATEGHRAICEYLLKEKADPALSYREVFFERQVGAVEAARENGHFDLANYIENFHTVR